MDYNQNSKHSGLAIASMVCGIVSLVTCCMGIGIPLAILAVTFALITLRKRRPMEPLAVAGIVTGIVGFILGMVIAIYTIYMVSSPYFQRGMYDSLEEEYGEYTADEMLEMFGADLEEIKGLDLEGIEY